MARIISQDTFDSVVKENMQDFNMTAQEAVDDAISQFCAQNVNLGNIIRDAKLYETEGDKSHPLYTLINNFSKNIEDNESTNIIENLDQIKQFTDKDLPHKLLAGKLNSFKLYIKLCENLDLKINENIKVLEHVLLNMCSLCYGQPDLFTRSSGVLIISFTELEATKIENILLPCIKFLRYICIMHEENRSVLIDLDIIKKAIKLLQEFENSALIVIEICLLLQSLTLDDDPRSLYGKASETVKKIVTECDSLSIILKLCKLYVNNSNVVYELFGLLGKLLTRDEYCRHFMDLGGLKLVIELLEINLKSKKTIQRAMIVMKVLAGSDPVKIKFAELGAIEFALSIISTHQKNEYISEAGFAMLTMICLRNPAHCTRVIKANGAEIITRSMQLHCDIASHQKQACSLIRNLTARTKENIPYFLQNGAEDLIRDVLGKHRECLDEAKAALRDMDCKVELKELWTGEGKGVTC